MQTYRILRLVAFIFCVTLAFYGEILSQKTQITGRLSKLPRSLYILYPSELNPRVCRYQSEASVVVAEITQTPPTSTVLAILLSWPINCHYIVFRTTFIELGFDFLIDEPLIILETLLDMYFELDDIIQNLLDFSVQLFTQHIGAKSQLFES